MLLLDHRLHREQDDPCDFVPSPNRGGSLTPEYLVIHYTAGRDARESIDWLTNRRAQASAHLVIDRDGEVTQLVPFDAVAWHAGQSSWEGRVGLNRWSIGIELDNPGRVTRRNGHWWHWTGSRRYDERDVLEATHKNESSPAGWHVYPPEQLESALAVASALVAEYGLRDVVGHDDISPGRKSDPGPAFPMESFRARVFGRVHDEAPVHRTTVALNIRTGPGAQFATLPQSPLPQGTRVEVLTRQGSWWLVDVLDTVGGAMDLQGWVHSRYLERA
jgi:N-acetylmuramoyl-L-alanine amidase